MIYTKGVEVEQIGPTMEMFRIANVVENDVKPAFVSFVSKRVEGEDIWVMVANYETTTLGQTSSIHVSWSPEIREALIKGSYEQFINKNLRDGFKEMLVLIPVDPKDGIYVPLGCSLMNHNDKYYIEFAMTYQVGVHMMLDDTAQCLTGYRAIMMHNDGKDISNTFYLEPDKWNMRTVIQLIRERIGSQGILQGFDDDKLLGKWIPQTYVSRDMDIDMAIYHRETFGMDAQLVSLGGVD